MRSKSKYSARKTEYGGVLYDSKGEAVYAAHLDLMKRATDPTARVQSWVRQVTAPITVNGVHICDLRPDFLVTFADGREEYHEWKGLQTPVWRLKEKLFRACYPGRVLLVLPERVRKKRHKGPVGSGKAPKTRVGGKRGRGGVGGL